MATNRLVDKRLDRPAKIKFEQVCETDSYLKEWVVNIAKRRLMDKGLEHLAKVEKKKNGSNS